MLTGARHVHKILLSLVLLGLEAEKILNGFVELVTQILGKTSFPASLRPIK